MTIGHLNSFLGHVHFDAHKLQILSKQSSHVECMPEPVAQESASFIPCQYFYQDDLTWKLCTDGPSGERVIKVSPAHCRLEATHE